VDKIYPIDSKAFTSLVISDFATAEKLYSKYNVILHNKEERKPEMSMYYLY
jgi:hypothetical protein